MTLSMAFLLLVVGAALAAAGAIRNHTTWRDIQGDPIDCHEGGILRVGKIFYWYGRAYKGHSSMARKAPSSAAVSTRTARRTS